MMRENLVWIGVLAAFACRQPAAFPAEARPSGPPPLRTIAEVLAAPAADRDGKLPVRVRGMLTMIHPHADAAVVQDETGGLWLNVAGVKVSGKSRLVQPGMEGSEVVIRGLLHRGGYSPSLQVRSIEVTGKSDLPAAMPADFERLYMGDDNGLRVTCEGVVQACSRNETQMWGILACQSRRIPFFLLAFDGLPAPDELLDATLRIDGVVGSVRNTRGEFLAPQLVCSRRSDVAVVKPPPSTPFEAPAVPLAELGRYRLESLSPHRVVAEGTVSFACDDLLFIQDGLRGVRVRTAAPAGVALGDRIRVAGFVDKGRRIAGIDGGLVEAVDRGLSLEPIAITPDEVARINNFAIDRHMMAEPSDCDGCLVTFPATVIETQRSDGGGDLVLSAGESTVAARLEGDAFAPLAELLPGSRVQITGVLEIHLRDDDGTRHVTSTPTLRQMSVHLRDAGDVVVLSRPSWWTPGRLGVLLGGVLAALAAVLVWVMMLRREVAAQSRMLAHEMQSRRDAALEFAASIRERNRLAANLHDTLLQTLRGIDFQLGACRAYRHSPDADSGEHLEVARRMVNHAAEELRDSVWALRTMPLAGRSFGESLDAVARQAGHGHAEHITTRVDGARFELPQFVAGNLLLVAQEAIHNALRHADANDIEVVASFDPAVGEVTVRVADDGCGFTPGKQPGPDQGHFGIAGMRERIERLGGSVSVTSTPDGGTVVTARVRKRDYDARIDVDAEDVPAGVT